VFDTPAKKIREDIARARAALGKGELPRSLAHLLDAVRAFTAARILGREKAEVQAYLQEYLRELNRHPAVKSHFTARNVHVTPYVKYRNGAEAELARALAGLLEELEHRDRQDERRADERRARRKEDLLAPAQAALESGELPKAKALLRRVAEEYGQEPGVLADCGQRLLRAGLFLDAGELLERAVAQDPRDSRALAWAVQAYSDAREFSKVEALYRQALQTFGNHPRTLLHMARMYMEWRKFDDAYDCARKALEADPALDEARAIMDQAGGQIFTR
jgi:tetratricopeptide (TPR) repeat protein